MVSVNKFSVLLLFLVGCVSQGRIAEEREWRSSNGRIKVLTTICMINDLVKRVGGEDVDTIPLIRGELDPHTYELVKGDGEKFAKADLIFYNGLGLEHSLSLRRHLEGNLKAIAVAEPLIEEDASLILVVDGQYDPHVWTDITLWAKTIDPIVAALSQLEPSKAARFQERGELLKRELLELDRKAFEELQAVRSEKRFLVTSHDAFNYFARRYLKAPGETDWKQRFQAPEGLAPEAQLSVTDIMAVIDHIKQHNVHVLFPESNVSRDSLKKILSAGREKGCLIRLCEEPLFGDAMGEGQSYLEMMQHNVSVIARNLNEDESARVR